MRGSVCSGVGNSVELRSPDTGALVKVLATFGRSFTNNGMARSPDGGQWYVTQIGRRTLRIERLSVADGTRRFVANGAQPAVSPDGERLAYAEGAPSFHWQALAVRDLSTGSTWRIDLGHVLGRSADLINGTVTWLGDGSDIVVLPGAVARPIGAPGRPAGAAARGSCSAVPTATTCLLLIHLSSTGRPLHAQRVLLRGIPGIGVTLRGGGTSAHALLLGDARSSRTAIDQITFTRARPTVARLLTTGPIMPVAFDPAGRHLLYLKGHSPPALWIGQLTGSRLVGRHRVDRKLAGLRELVSWLSRPPGSARRPPHGHRGGAHTDPPERR
jgi:hypothetical protein